MIELTELINQGEPFPRKPAVVFTSEYDLIKKYGFTLNEIETALKQHKLIRGKYILQLSHRFLDEIPHDRLFAGYKSADIKNAVIDAMREQAVDEIIKNANDKISMEEIAEILGVSYGAIRQMLSRIYKKLATSPELRENLSRISEIKNHGQEYRVSIKSKITIKFDD